MRLIGERPQSINGCKLSITTDGNLRVMRNQSTEIHIERKDKSDCAPMAQPGYATAQRSAGNPTDCRLNYAEK
jgi:hypothetical protein